MIDLDDTIVAIASPTEPAVRGVVRFSGADSTAVLGRLGIDCPVEESAHRFPATVDLESLGSIPVDVLHWPTERSYTGQISAELHTFGSLPILRGIVNAAINLGARAARPGEFTMRAFLAGRLDLTQAEAVLGVIEAEQRGSLDHALRQLAGNLAEPVGQMRTEVLNLLADVEAGLDFVDEDIEFISDQDLADRLTRIQDQLAATADKMRLRDGAAGRLRIALRGDPNAGKSSLLNCLVGRPAAIVSDTAGTTRDTVTADATLGEFPVTMIDTAGIEEQSNTISVQSQHQADRAGREATIRIWCVDRSDPGWQSTADRLRSVAELDRPAGAIDLWVLTKIDRVDVGVESIAGSEWVACSTVTRIGIGPLIKRVADTVSSRDVEQVGSVIGTAARCRQSIKLAGEAIGRAIEMTLGQEGHEFVSAELRTCADALGEVTGAVYTDDILDRVFSRFCIGK